jgi:hypothetical protein
LQQEDSKLSMSKLGLSKMTKVNSMSRGNADGETLEGDEVEPLGHDDPEDPVGEEDGDLRAAKLQGRRAGYRDEGKQDDKRSGDTQLRQAGRIDAAQQDGFRHRAIQGKARCGEDVEHVALGRAQVSGE